MEELTIFEFQAKEIQDTLRQVANILKSHSRETAVDRSIMVSAEMLENIINKDHKKVVKRF